MNVYEYQYETPEGKEICFQWITDIGITKTNLEEMIETGSGVNRRYRYESQYMRISVWT